MKSLLTKLMLLLGCALPYAVAQSLACGPSGTTLIPLAGNQQVGQMYVYDPSGGSVTFKYSGATYPSGAPVPEELNYIVMIPSTGTAPAGASVGVTVGWNPLVLPLLKPGLTYSEYALFTVGQGTTGGACRVDLRVPPEPNPAIQSVLNAASLQPRLSPGAMVSIFGSHLTGPTLSTNYDKTAFYPTSVASTSVTFNGIAAPLLYLSPGQINAIVPFSLAGQTSVQVVVQRFGQFSGALTSAAFTLPLQDTSPAIFTAGQNGAGQGAILQQGSDGQFTYNSSANPAPQGAALEIFATGMGMWTPPPQSDVSFFGGSFKTQPVSVTIGGQPAKVLSAGTTGDWLPSWSVLQVNAVVPNGIGPAAQPVVLKIGANDNSQQGVTMWIQ